MTSHPPAASGGSAGRASRNSRSRALVLGPGGLVGTAWTIGLAAGLRSDGIELGDADLLVGTSAGAIAGAMIGSRQALDRLAEPSAPAEADAPAVLPDQLAQVFSVLGDPSLGPREALRRVGQLALAAPTASEQVHVARMASLIAVSDWPDLDLRIVAVDVDSGEGAVFDRASAVALPAAVAASCAMPGAYPPVTINGRRYMDGAFRAGSNVDLAIAAAGGGTDPGDGPGVLVVVEPLAHLFPRAPGTPDPATADGTTMLRIVPDPSTIDAFGSDLHDQAAWRPSYRAGRRQARESASRLGEVWSG